MEGRVGPRESGRRSGPNGGRAATRSRGENVRSAGGLLGLALLAGGIAAEGKATRIDGRRVENGVSDAIRASVGSGRDLCLPFASDRVTQLRRVGAKRGLDDAIAVFDFDGQALVFAE